MNKRYTFKFAFLNESIIVYIIFSLRVGIVNLSYKTLSLFYNVESLPVIFDNDNLIKRLFSTILILLFVHAYTHEVIDQLTALVTIS